MPRTIASTALLAFAVATASAQTTAKVADFDWMSGIWTTTSGHNVIERTCSKPLGASMMCMMRVIAGGNVVWLEFSVLSDTEKGLTFETRFFTPDAQPADPVSAKLFIASASANEWTFENPTGTQPKRETIHRTGPDEMTASADLIDAQGKTTSMGSTWRRVH